MRRLRAGCIVAACGCLVPLAAAQAPSSAQVWDVRFVVDASGPFAAGPTATQVGITIFARVGILPNTVDTRTLGVSRVGGMNASFEFSDPLAASLGVSQGSAQRGLTADIDGRVLFDTSGDPLAGHFAPFRGSFSPQDGPLFLASNTDPANGILMNPLTGSPLVTNVVGARGFNFGSEGSGPVGLATAIDNDPLNLIGDLAPVYRIYYLPRADLPLPRNITLRATGVTARYLIIAGSINQSSGAFAIPDQTITFQVPAPAAAASLALLAAAILRRRR